VGPGTFKPVSADNIDDHVVDPEWAELPESAARVLNGVRDGGGRITAVGTTSVRTLESVVRGDGRFVPLAGMVDLYIRPGYHFRGVDRLITNFHLPRSSLLILVAAFAGRDRILEAYRYAIAQRMRFYSYGDAMLIL
ncbi:MAG TPA: S-adenosylmethionine:tRNA ribosyltransferase-isomerase, partial [candidate division Zixibacteria bacterium]|nr:S-adenosylmethionine:tRNA ribosyltransferase-isomerase [candidate division Zixibacteria bacterium]